MYERFDKYSVTRPRLRKIAGWTLVVVGFVALVAPIIPGAPVVFIGLELLGLRIIFMDKIKGIIRREKVSPAPVVSLEGIQEKVG